MPICEADPWRFQYFEHIDCPPDVRISTEDPDSWEWFPEHRWIYDKLAVALSQGLQAAPHGVMPPSFPVFSKPIMNLRGMGTGSQVIASAEEYRAALTAGHFWCTLLTGPHVSTDVALVDGEPRWWRHTTGATGPGGTFDHWLIHAEPMPEHRGLVRRLVAPATCAATPAWPTSRRSAAASSRRIFASPTNGLIFMVPAGSRRWCACMSPGDWVYPDADRVDGYSVVLFGPHGPRYRHPPAALVDEVRAMPGVSSVQITFHEDKAPEHHAMPPGGFRLAIVNARALDAGQAGRERLRQVLMPHSTG